MTQRDDLDQMLSAWLDDPYTPPAPRYLVDVLERTRRTRQRPAWANLERWLPMADKTLGRTTSPSMRLAWLVLIGLLLAGLIGAAVVGSGLIDSKAPIAEGGAAVLAFASIEDLLTDGSRNDIYTVRADGTDLRRLTHGLTTDTAPAFSPDGTRIAYRNWDSGIDSLVVMDAGGGDPLTLATNTADRADCPRGALTWSPEGSTIIFPVSAACEEGYDLHIVATDGSMPAKKLLADGTDSLHAAWSPDGARLAFLGSDTAGGVGLYLVDVTPASALAGGLTPRRFGTTSGDLANSAGSLQWSPDGKELATISQSGDLIVIKPDGSDRRVIAPQALSPRWAPDGRRLAFHRQVDPSEYFQDRPCTVRTWIVEADGSDERRLEDLGDGCDAPPSWSPDGTRITGVVIASTDAEPELGFHLGIITIDGSSPTVILRDGPSVSWQPVAAPLPPPPSFSTGSAAP